MNTSHVIEVAVLLLVAFLIGCVIGYLLRRLFAPARVQPAETMAAPPTPASPLPERTETQVAPRPQSAERISGAMAGAAAAAGASDIAAQVRDPGDTGNEEGPESEPEPVQEGDADEDRAALAALDGAPAAEVEPEPAPRPEPEIEEPLPPADEDDNLDSTAEADAEVGSGNRPPALPGPRGGTADNLQKIKGIGPKLEGTLNSLGVYHFDQIAAWNRGNVEWVDTFLSFKGRIDREDWTTQARAFAGQSEPAEQDIGPDPGRMGEGGD